MNRKILRNIGRIPRLNFHIKRVEAKGQPERAEALREELKRRRFQMMADGFEDLLAELDALELDRYPNEDSARLKEIMAAAEAEM